jgi:cytochrome b561
MNKPLTIRILHWLVVLLFLFAIPSGYRLADTGWPGIGWINRDGIRIIHQTAGILSACFMVYWGLLRLLKNSGSYGGLWEKLITISHILFAILAATIALTGWMGSSAGNYGQALFGVLPVPNIIPTLSAKEAVWLYTLHKSLIPYFITFLGLHVAAVLFHTLILKDGILRAMWFRKD